MTMPIMRLISGGWGLVSIMAAATLVGCGEQPPPGGSGQVAAPGPSSPPSAMPGGPGSPGVPTAPEDPAVASFLGFNAPKPATWIWQPPESAMRAANYVVPGQDGSDQAHLVVFQGIGGSNEENITRWEGQFRAAEGEPAAATVTEMTVGDLPVTIVELSGEYMKMGTTWYTPDQLFLAAIVSPPEGPIHIRLAGDQNTVEANREAFMEMIGGLTRAP